MIKQGRDAKAITIDKRSDAGAVRGGVFGGTAGLVLATILGWPTAGAAS